MALKHAKKAVGLPQLMDQIGFISSQTFKSSLRFPVTGGILIESENTGEPVYARASEKGGSNHAA